MVGVISPVVAQTTKPELVEHIQAQKAAYEDIALKIWGYAEVGFKETKSSALLQAQLATEGFKVEAGVAGIPTAFVASFGSGHPIIGIMGEFDALPGVAQAAVPLGGGGGRGETLDGGHEADGHDSFLRHAR